MNKKINFLLLLFAATFTQCSDSEIRIITYDVKCRKCSFTHSGVSGEFAEKINVVDHLTMNVSVLSGSSLSMYAYHELGAISSTPDTIELTLLNDGKVASEKQESGYLVQVSLFYRVPD